MKRTIAALASTVLLVSAPIALAGPAEAKKGNSWDRQAQVERVELSWLGQLLCRNHPHHKKC